MTTYRRAIANKADTLITEANIARHKAELMAANFKGEADSMQSLARECLDLMRQLVSATDVRPAPGVYFLMNKAGEIIYVGQSENVMFRMAGHKEKDFHTVRMIHITKPLERNRLEQRFIHLLKPPINIQYLGVDRSHELLCRKFEIVGA